MANGYYVGYMRQGRYSTWYPLCIRLADIDGIEAYTFAGNEKQHQPFFKVSAEYGYVLYKGMKETYPKMSDDEIWQYLHGCGE